MSKKGVLHLGRPLVWLALLVVLLCAVYSFYRLESLPDTALYGTMTAVIAEVDDDRLFLRDVRMETEHGTQELEGNVLMEAEPCGCELVPGVTVQAEVTLEPLRPPVNPHGWDERTWYLTDGVIYRTEGALLGHSETAPFSLRTWMRSLTMEHIDALWPEEGGVITALLMGVEDDLSEETQEAFRRSGAAHLMAVSGLHVGFVAALAMLCFKWLRRNSWVQIVLTLAFMAAYGLLAESAFSVYRAMAMLAAGLLAGHFGRRADGPTSLAVAVIAALLMNPAQVLCAGFLMSVCAVLGVLMLNGRLDAMLKKIIRPAYLRSLITVSFSAQLGVLPVQVYVFHSLNLLSLLTNLAAVPLAAGIVMLGLPTVFLHMLLPGAAAIPGFIVGLMARVLTLVCETVANIGFAQVNVASPPVFVLLCAFGLLFLCSPYFMEFGRKGRIVLAAGLLCAATVSLLLWLPGELEQRSVPTATFLSVGTADSTLLRSEDGNVLIDTGWSGSQAASLAEGEGLGIDAVILTHRDGDHAGGLARVLESVPVGAVFVPRGMSWEGMEEALAAAEKRGIPIEELYTGDSFTVGEFDFTVLSPDFVREDRDNEDSLVLRVCCRDTTMLMMGDVTAEAEERLALPDCDILKIPHHGSATGTSMALLEKTAPEIAVISVGKDNLYGFPREEAVQRLKDAGAQILRTDECGAVTVRLDEAAAAGYEAPSVWERLFIE